MNISPSTTQILYINSISSSVCNKKHWNKTLLTQFMLSFHFLNEWIEARKILRIFNNKKSEVMMKYWINRNYYQCFFSRKYFCQPSYLSQYTWTWHSPSIKIYSKKHKHVWGKNGLEYLGDCRIVQFWGCLPSSKNSSWNKRKTCVVLRTGNYLEKQLLVVQTAVCCLV